MKPCRGSANTSLRKITRRKSLSRATSTWSRDRTSSSSSFVQSVIPLPVGWPDATAWRNLPARASGTCERRTRRRAASAAAIGSASSAIDPAPTAAPPRRARRLIGVLHRLGHGHAVCRSRRRDVSIARERGCVHISVTRGERATGKLPSRAPRSPALNCPACAPRAQRVSGAQVADEDVPSAGARQITLKASPGRVVAGQLVRVRFTATAPSRRRRGAADPLRRRRMRREPPHRAGAPCARVVRGPPGPDRFARPSVDARALPQRARAPGARHALRAAAGHGACERGSAALRWLTQPESTPTVLPYRAEEPGDPGQPVQRERSSRRAARSRARAGPSSRRPRSSRPSRGSSARGSRGAPRRCGG